MDLPDLPDAAQASASVACHLTLPGATFGLTKPSPGITGAEPGPTSRLVAGSMAAALGTSSRGRTPPAAGAGPDSVCTASRAGLSITRVFVLSSPGWGFGSAVATLGGGGPGCDD